MSWAVAVLQPGRHRTAQVNLDRQGFEHYSPLMLNPRTRRPEPLFTGYMFIALQAAWRSIMGTRGVARLLLQGDRPAQLPDETIQAIRDREQDGLIQFSAQSAFDHGQPVRLGDGPFEGWTALYDCKTPGERAQVLLTLMGRVVRVRVAEDQLLAV